MNRPSIKLVAAVVLGLSFSSLSLADSSAKPDSGWHYLITPYLWASALNGDVTVRNFSKHSHVPFSELLEHLDFAAQGHVEAGYGPLTLMIDPTYIKVSENKQSGDINAKLTSTTVLIDGGFFYRVFATPIACKRFLSLEALSGARHLGVKNQFDFSNPLPSASSNTQMTAPIVGGRFKFDLTPKTHFWLRGDYGGFHIDDVTKTWSGTAGISYTVNPHVDLGVAYRVLRINYSKKNTSMDTLMYGPMIGVGFHS